MTADENVELIKIIKSILLTKSRNQKIDKLQKKQLEQFYTKKTIRKHKIFNDLLNPKKKNSLTDFLDLYDEQSSRFNLQLRLKYLENFFPLAQLK